MAKQMFLLPIHKVRIIIGLTAIEEHPIVCCFTELLGIADSEICKCFLVAHHSTHILVVLGTLYQCEQTETVGKCCDGFGILDSGVFRYGGQLIELHIRIADGSHKVVDIIDAFA